MTKLKLKTLVENLRVAFIWNETPQGFGYWSDVSRRLDRYRYDSDGCPLPTEPSLKREGPFLFESLSVPLVRSLAADLLISINRSNTIEGFDYWREVYSNLLGLCDMAETEAAKLSEPPLKEFGKLINPMSRQETVKAIKAAGGTCLGEGSYGTVYSMPGRDDYVIKVSNWGKSITDGWPVYARMVLDHGSSNPHLMRIYSLIQCDQPDAEDSFFVSLMERLDRPSDTYLNHNQTRSDANLFLKGILDEVPHLEPELQSALKMIKRHLSGYEIDLHGANFMVRGNTFVITDPVSWTNIGEPTSRTRRSSNP